MVKTPGKNAADHISSAAALGQPSPSWAELAAAFAALYDYMTDQSSGYRAFETAYIADPNNSGDPWADEDLKKLLEMFSRANGPG